MNHTPTPWRIMSWGDGRLVGVADSNISLAQVNSPYPIKDAWEEEGKANAAFIVQSVNMHYNLWASLKGSQEILQALKLSVKREQAPEIKLASEMMSNLQAQCEINRHFLALVGEK
jgi:hypothetical protein